MFLRASVICIATLGLFISSVAKSATTDFSASSNFNDQSPTDYGIFIGARDGDLQGDINAEKIAQSFLIGANNKSASAKALTFKVNINENESFDTLDASVLFAFINNIKKEDSLTLYINGHGWSIDEKSGQYNADGIGDEVINIGILLKDDTLSGILSNLVVDGVSIKKTVFLDSCHSGGFWGKDVLANDILASDEKIDDFYPPEFFRLDKDLRRLDNIALFAAAEEDRLGYFWGEGFTFWGKALHDALQLNLSMDDLGEFLEKETRKNSTKCFAGILFCGTTPVWYKTDLGFDDPVEPDPNLIKVFQAASEDYNMHAPLIRTVPEPSVSMLLAIGLFFMVIVRYFKLFFK